MSKLTPSQSEVRASLRGRLEDVIEELEAVRGVMRDELHIAALHEDPRICEAQDRLFLVARALA